MKKVLTALFTAIFTVVSLTMNVSGVTYEPSADIKSHSVYLLNMDTKTVIYEKNAEEEQMPGALVNIMTAIVVMENCSEPDDTTITANDDLYKQFDDYEFPDDLRYADIWDKDVFSVTDLLYAMLLTSSCEAAVILADYIGNGNTDSFVEKMNAKAAEIGCTDTLFTNPHGLYDPAQHTTAKDMAMITQYALTVPGFEDIACTSEYQMKPRNKDNAHEGDWTISHSNVMMSNANDYYLYGVKGIKTGNLQLGGRAIVTLGSNDGIKYLLVIMGAPMENEDGETRYYHIIDAYEIMSWAFESFSYTTLLERDAEMGEIKVANSDGNDYVLIKPERAVTRLWYSDIDVTAIQRKTSLATDVSAPVKKGQKLGEIELRLGDELIDVVDLVAADDVDRSLIKFNFSAAMDFFGSKWFYIGLGISVVISFLYLLLCIWAYNEYKNYSKRSFSNKKVVKKLNQNNRRR